MRNVILFLCLFCGVSLFAQEINIDFEETSLVKWAESDSGHWHIDTLASINGTGSLHHNFDASESASDVISYKHTQLLLDSANAEWQFSVKYNYAPSASNNWALWLTSNKDVLEMNPAGASQGYIIGVNYTGSDDLVKIWRQGEGNGTAIITSVFNWQDNISFEKPINFKILRSPYGEWTLQIDTLGGEYFTIGTGIDLTYSKSDYIGVFYKYSSTQDRKLWIDDISLKGFFHSDEESPKISSFLIQEQNEILIVFDEEIDTIGEMLFILNREYEPDRIEWVSTTKLVLSYNTNFGPDNLLEIYGLKDLNGNVSQIEQVNFQYFTPELHDVIISEIMADPNPKVGLPECEYIELFNRSAKILNLDGWTFRSGNRTPISIENCIIKPGAFVLLVDKNYVNDFPDSIQKVSISSFPSLPNSGEILVLRDTYKQTIHSLTYANNMHSIDEKEEGGWSLEMVDFSYPCLTTNNLISSVFIGGGTPGFHNSVEGDLEYYPTSILESVNEISENNCIIKFSESLDSISATITANYQLITSGISIDSALPTSPLFKEIRLNFSESLSTENLYTLEISDALLDCSGIGILAEPLTFGLPQKADSTDLIINELLFDANDLVPEYIELYNKSDKVVDLKGFSIVGLDAFTDSVKSSKVITSKNYQLFPKSYLVLTQDKGLLQNSVSSKLYGTIIESDSWLNLSNDGGKIALINSLSETIDEAIYSPEMHFSLLKNTSGVSLERISEIQSGLNPKNWHSASTSANYATPGEVNSQNNTKDDSFSQVSISPKEFSPDNDGFNDFLSIQYNFLKGGFVTTVKIYNQQGSLVNHLVNNELCGLTGKFIWDGLDENGGRLAMGYYIILFEAWHSDGSLVKEKKLCLLLPEIK